jgi:hypothetical protein
MLANAVAHMYGAGFGGTMRSSSADTLLRLLGLPPKHVSQYLQYLDTVLPDLTQLVTPRVQPSPRPVQYST